MSLQSRTPRGLKLAAIGLIALSGLSLGGCESGLDPNMWFDKDGNSNGNAEILDGMGVILDSGRTRRFSTARAMVGVLRRMEVRRMRNEERIEKQRRSRQVQQRRRSTVRTGNTTRPTTPQEQQQAEQNGRTLQERNVYTAVPVDRRTNDKGEDVTDYVMVDSATGDIASDEVYEIPTDDAQEVAQESEKQEKPVELQGKKVVMLPPDAL